MGKHQTRSPLSLPADSMAARVAGRLVKAPL